MITTTQPTIQRAARVVADEIDVIAAERDAFRQLLARLDRIDAGAVPASTRVSAVGASGGTGSLLYARSGSTGERMSAVRTAYRETVMAAAHYDCEYGDSLPESLRTEFGESLAEQIVADGPLTPMVRNAFVDAARDAMSDRTRFLDILRTEQSSLETAERELNAIESRVVELSETVPGEATAELDCLESRCVDVAEDRQELIHDRSVRSMSGVGSNGLLAYLYGDMEARCPVLSDASSCLRTIRAVRDD